MMILGKASSSVFEGEKPHLPQIREDRDLWILEEAYLGAGLIFRLIASDREQNGWSRRYRSSFQIGRRLLLQICIWHPPPPSKLRWKFFWNYKIGIQSSQVSATAHASRRCCRCNCGNSICFWIRMRSASIDQCLVLAWIVIQEPAISRCRSRVLFCRRLSFHIGKKMILFDRNLP